jgi:hypothetical protein
VNLHNVIDFGVLIAMFVAWGLCLFYKAKLERYEEESKQ